MPNNTSNLDPMIVDKIDTYVDGFNSVEPLYNAHNLYATASPEGVMRASNLRKYLTAMAIAEPRVLLIGEAPGYQGTLRTGVPFASEHAIATGQAVLSEVANYSLPEGLNSYKKEPTSTIVCRALQDIDATPLLWAIYPHHPHKPGNPQSNRAPTRSEITTALPLLHGLLDIFDGIDRIVAVGNVAKQTTESLGINALKVRHPSHGGATQFAAQLKEIMTQDQPD